MNRMSSISRAEIASWPVFTASTAERLTIAITSPSTPSAAERIFSESADL